MSSEHNLPPEITPPSENSSALWAKYVENRFRDPAIYTATSLSRDLKRPLQETEKQHYKESILQAGKQIQQALGISPEIFQDEARSEVFLAIADSWVATTKEPGHTSGEHVSAEENFLIHAARLLAGSSSRFNQAELVRGERYASYYIGTGTTGLASTHIENIRQWIHQDTTEQLRRYFMADPQSFTLIKERLGESVAEIGKNWDVVVIDTALQSGASSEPQKKRWGDESMAGADAFVDWYEDKFVIYLTQQTATALLQNEPQAVKLFEHEFVHALRTPSIIVGENHWHGLGQMFNEYAAGLVAQDETYPNTRVFFHAMHATQPDPTLGESIFLEGLKNQKVATYYQYISNTFGFRTLLLLMAHAPEMYTQIQAKQAIPMPFDIASIAESQEMHQRHRTILDTEIAALRERTDQIVGYYQTVGDMFPEGDPRQREAAEEIALQEQVTREVANDITTEYRDETVALALLGRILTEAIRINPETRQRIKAALPLLQRRYEALHTYVKRYHLAQMLDEDAS